MPAHRHRAARPQRDGLFEAALADETPRANDVGNDVDHERGGGGVGHGLSPVSPLSYPLRREPSITMG
jgi:hypothetical protein